MQGNVFQTYSETQKRGLFLSTMEALQTYMASKFSEDTAYLRPLFKDLKTPNVPMPIRPPIPEDRTEVKEKVDTDRVLHKIVVDLRSAEEKLVDDIIFNEEIKQWVKNRERLRGTERSLYDIVKGQCSRLMWTTIEGLADFEEINSKNDVTRLLTAIRTISNQIASDMCIYDAYLDSLQVFFDYRQQKATDLTTCLRQFKHYIECAEQFGPGALESSGLVAH